MARRYRRWVPPEPTGTEPSRQQTDWKEILGPVAKVAFIVGGIWVIWATLISPWLNPEEQKPPKPNSLSRSVGESVVLSEAGWTLTVNDLLRRQSVEYAFSTEHALGMYLQVDLTMRNIAKEAQTLGADRFTLFDSQGRKYPVFVAKGEVGSRINPSLVAKGSLIFDVPPDASGLVLQSVGGFRVKLGDMRTINGPPQ